MNREDVKSPQKALGYFREEYPDMFTESYQVVGNYEVVVASRIIRIETIKRLDVDADSYDVRVYEDRSNGWEPWTNFPSCSGHSETELLIQAQSFLWDALRSQRADQAD